MAKAPPLRRSLIFAVVATAIGLLVVEGLVSVFLAVTAVLGVSGITEEAHCDYDETLGWSNRRGIHIPDLYGPGLSYTTNSQGFRSTAGDFGHQVPTDRYRIIVLGDSFTMGYGVGDEDTYPAQMEALCPRLQVVNMGLGGYGLGQDYLWYMRDGRELDADLLVFAFIAGDFHRMLSDEFLGYGKPILHLEGGVLEAGNVPVPRKWGTRRMWLLGQFVRELSIGRTADWVIGGIRTELDSMADDGESFAPVAGRIFEEMQRVSMQRGQDFATVYLPVVRSLSEEPTAQARWVEDFTDRNGIPFINLTSDFETVPLREIDRMQIGGDSVPGVTSRRDRQPPNPHYSPFGNRFVAERLLAHLARRFPDLPCRWGPEATRLSSGDTSAGH